jgi:CheY-like chemotaxis protein
MTETLLCRNFRSGAHVLVVDDDEAWAAAAGRMLERGGFTVRIAADYRRALEILESPDPIDVMLTDIVMPRQVNGVALGRMARMRRPSLRLLYITAYEIPGLEAEVDGMVLQKSISEQDLVGAVAQALAG